MLICYRLTVTFGPMVRACLGENEGMGLLKPERKMLHIEKGICGQVGERAVEVGKMESNRT